MVEELNDEMRQCKRDLERRVISLESKLESQKIDLTHEHEDIVATMEKQMTEREEQLKRKSLQLELKVEFC